jgi:hypothetical protein
MYDYYLGGTHSFPADEQAAEAVVAQLPCVPWVARANRAFVIRAVRYLVEQAGVRQFLDIGAGLPGRDNVHDIAQASATAVVAYVDRDTIAVAEFLDRIEGNPCATAFRGDLCRPEAILDHRRLRQLVDFSQPIGLLLGAVLHYLPDTAEAYHVVGQLVDALPAGSYVVISHAAAEAFPPQSQRCAEAIRTYQRFTGATPAPRHREEVRRFFTGLRLLEPGVVAADEWHPDPGPGASGGTLSGAEANGCWAALGVKPPCPMGRDSPDTVDALVDDTGRCAAAVVTDTAIAEAVIPIRVTATTATGTATPGSARAGPLQAAHP